MKALSLFATFGFLAVLASPLSVSAQAVIKLSTQDFIDLQQLTAGYPYKIDHCTNSGYDYADQYTDDAVFFVCSEL